MTVRTRGCYADEIVHHRDEDTANDDPSNLEITTRASHMDIHRASFDHGKRLASVRAANARKTPEERRAIALKVWETRRMRGT